MSAMFATYNPRSQDMANVIYLDREEEKEKKFCAADAKFGLVELG